MPDRNIRALATGDDLGDLEEGRRRTVTASSPSLCVDEAVSGDAFPLNVGRVVDAVEVRARYTEAQKYSNLRRPSGQRR